MATEGNLQAPTRHPLDWKNPDFYNEASCFKELERIFDICHGCRRCFSLCNAFPTLFDAIDESSSGELDGVAHVAQVLEVHALDDAAGGDVETRDDAARESHVRASRCGWA